MEASATVIITSPAPFTRVQLDQFAEARLARPVRVGGPADPAGRAGDGEMQGTPDRPAGRLAGPEPSSDDRRGCHLAIVPHPALPRRPPRRVAVSGALSADRTCRWAREAAEEVACVARHRRLFSAARLFVHPAEWMTVGAPESRSGADVDAALWSAPSATRTLADRAGAPVRRRRREARPVSAATTRSRTPDRLCAEAVDLARAAAEEAAAPGVVGEHVGRSSPRATVSSRTSSSARRSGYRGWRWAVTVARASRAKTVTLDEMVLLPGPDALLAPEWVPWSERLRPGDMGPGDLLPTDAEDLRLEPGYSGEDEPAAELAPVSARHGRAGRGGGRRASPARPANAAVAPARGSIAVGRRGARHAPGARPVPVRAAHAPPTAGRRPSARRPRWRRPRPRPVSAAASWCRSAGSLRPGLRRLRERVRAGGRPRGVPVVRLRRPLGGGGHAEAAAAGAAGARRDAGRTRSRCGRRPTPGRCPWGRRSRVRGGSGPLVGFAGSGFGGSRVGSPESSGGSVRRRVRLRWGFSRSSPRP